MSTSENHQQWLKQTARKLRKDSTGPERVLWQLLRDRRLEKLKFRRQVPFGPYIVDFICHGSLLIIELDGESHNDRGEDDKARQKWIEEQGYQVLRFSNDDILLDPEVIILEILKHAGKDLSSIDDRFDH
ncbi:endonuclease domain-containing protein [Calycomorphotria hydatis]|uniref:DUF559 domain-containing protein n=1 Tax=Calycomorphotria hydatis TaxID=2528027 RepID=A0A517T5Q6_9PLAN|nr:DUF559 domain-containing protein [Calycomorphotria hydatis]QDT63703.1 hypothetical protein V22_09280 [Calycomorphotria hydatis]